MKLRLGKYIMTFKWLVILLATMSMTVPVYSHNQEEDNDCETKPNPPPDNCDDCEKDKPCKCCDQVAGDPFLLSNGKFMENLEFFQFGGLLNMSIKLLFDDRQDYPSQVGQNWALNYVWRLYLSDSLNHPYIIRSGRGYRTKYELISGNQYKAVDREYEVLTVSGDGTAVLENKEGIEYYFDTDGRISSINNGKGAELRMTYVNNDKHAIIGLTEFTNVETPIVIARDYQVSRVEEFYGGVTSGRYYEFSYDTSGHIFQIQDHTSRTVLFTYSSAGELVTVQDPEGGLYQYSYEALGKIKSFSGINCGTEILPFSNYYDERGRITNQMIGTIGEGTEYVIEYPNSVHSDTVLYSRIKDDQGVLIGTGVERYSFNVDDYQSTVLKAKETEMGNGLVQEEEHWYDNQGRRTQTVFNAVATNSFTYDANGNLKTKRVQVSEDVFKITANTYSTDNNLMEISVHQTDRPGEYHKTRFTYDNSRRKTKERIVMADNSELVTEWQYDPTTGWVTNRIDPNGNAMAYEYNAYGFKTREYDPNYADYETKFFYDSRGNVTSKVDALDRVWIYAHDKLDRIVYEKNPLHYENLWTYSGANLTLVEEGRDGTIFGRIVSNEYNTLNKLTGVYRMNGAGQAVHWVKYKHDSEGNVLAEINALNYTNRFAYNLVGVMTNQVDAYGAERQFKVNVWGNKSEIKNAQGNVEQHNYDYLGRLTNRIEAIGLVEERAEGYRYDARGLRVEILRASVSSSTSKYDRAGRLLSFSGPGSYPEKYVYDANGNQIFGIFGSGYTNIFHYDAYNRLQGVTYADGSTKSNTYDLVNNLTARVDENGSTKYSSYDALNRLKATSIPDDQNTIMVTYSYNAFNEQVKTSNIVGGVTSSSCDGLGRVTNTVDAVGLSLKYDYDALDQLTRLSWPNNTYIEFYFENSRQVWIKDRADNVRSNAYDILGRLAFEVDEMGTTNHFEYDGLYRQVSVSNALKGARHVAYDSFNRISTVTYEDDQIDYFFYNEHGSVTNQYGARQYPMTYFYDLAGNITNMVDGNGSDTIWAYDARNRLIKKIYDDTSFYSYAYDPTGQLTNRIDTLGRSIVYRYNNQGLLTEIDYPFDSDLSFQYDRLGRRTNMVDALGRSSWSFDEGNRIIEQVQEYVSATNSYQYNAEGSRTSLVVRLSSMTNSYSYSYDSANRMAKVSRLGSVPQVYSYIWAPTADLVQEVIYPTGASISNRYDGLRRLLLKENRDSAGTLISSFSYGYDVAGLRTNVVYLDNRRRTYEYDEMRQLVSAEGFLSGGGLDVEYQYDYFYDEMGNYTNLMQNSEESIYFPNSLNQYTSNSIPVTSTINEYSYDSNGNLLDDGEKQYAWNEENQLVRVTNGTHRTEYDYNGLSFRVERREYESDILEKTARYVYDGHNVIVEADDSNTQKNEYVLGYDISLSFEGAGGIGGVLSNIDHSLSPSTTQHYFYDANGNVVDLLDSNDVLVAHYEYDPFGKVVIKEGEYSTNNTIRFSSKIHDSQVGLVYYGYRFYNPSIGRWINRDPIEERGSVNLYSFSGNSPVNYLDYKGLAICSKSTVREVPKADEQGELSDEHYTAGWTEKVVFQTSSLINKQECEPGKVSYEVEPPKCELRIWIHPDSDPSGPTDGNPNRTLREHEDQHAANDEKHIAGLYNAHKKLASKCICSKCDKYRTRLASKAATFFRRQETYDDVSLECSDWPPSYPLTRGACELKGTFKNLMDKTKAEMEQLLKDLSECTSKCN